MHYDASLRYGAFNNTANTIDQLRSGSHVQPESIIRQAGRAMRIARIEEDGQQKRDDAHSH